MSGVPNQGHFYCSAAFGDKAWIIYERSCKSKGIDGHFAYRCPNKDKAYKMRALLNKMYVAGMLSALARFRWYVEDHFSNIFLCDYFYAEQLWHEAAEVRADDSQVISAPIVSNGG